MKSLCFYAPLCVILLLSNLSLAQSSTVQRDPVLDLEVTRSYGNTTLVELLTALSGEYRFALGIEVSTISSESRIDAGSFDKTHLRDVLDELVKKDNRYRWEMKDGVVNVFPIIDRSEVLSVFLGTQIENFRPRKNLTKGELNSSIGKLPEVRSLLGPLSITVFAFDPPGIVDLGEICSIEGRGVTIREILNKVVKCSKNTNHWSVQMVGDKILSLNF